MVTLINQGVDSIFLEKCQVVRVKFYERCQLTNKEYLVLNERGHLILKGKYYGIENQNY